VSGSEEGEDTDADANKDDLKVSTKEEKERKEKKGVEEGEEDKGKGKEKERETKVETEEEQERIAKKAKELERQLEKERQRKEEKERKAKEEEERLANEISNQGKDLEKQRLEINARGIEINKQVAKLNIQQDEKQVAKLKEQITEHDTQIADFEKQAAEHKKQVAKLKEKERLKNEKIEQEKKKSDDESSESSNDDYDYDVKDGFLARGVAWWRARRKRVAARKATNKEILKLLPMLGDAVLKRATRLGREFDCEDSELEARKLTEIAHLKFWETYVNNLRDAVLNKLPERMDEISKLDMGETSLTKDLARSEPVTEAMLNFSRMLAPVFRAARKEAVRKAMETRQVRKTILLLPPTQKPTVVREALKALAKEQEQAWKKNLVTDVDKLTTKVMDILSTI
jgi:hypothetical protein